MWAPLTPFGGGGVLSNVAEPTKKRVPGARFLLFFGKDSPLKSSNQKTGLGLSTQPTPKHVPLLSLETHWASESARCPCTFLGEGFPY